MVKCLLLLPIILLFVGIAFVFVCLYKLFFINSIPMVDCSYDCLNTPTATIREISTKYQHRIRGSVRLSQGRIKSIEEIYETKNKIIFP